MFPQALLAKLFVKGSLKNNVNGFEFKIKNIIDTGTIIEVGSIRINEVDFPANVCFFQVDGKVVRGDEISNSNPLVARAFRDILINIEGQSLGVGTYKIGLQIVTREVGKLSFSVSENIHV